MKNDAAVIFDMDGVIVNSEPLHEQALRDVMKAIGWDNKHNLNFKDYIGKSDFMLWKDFVEIYRPKQALQELIVMKRSRVLELLTAKKPFFPGVVELIIRLAGKYPLAVASGSERLVIESVLSLRGLNRFFNVIVSGADVKEGKPAPDIFLKTAQLLKVLPSNCWVIEDSIPGIEAGRRAGMCVIAITNTHSAEELKNAHYIVSDYHKIEEIITENTPVYARCSK